MTTAAWRNWSGSVQCSAARVQTPPDEDALAQAIVAARQVRMVGAGHSFMPLCHSDDMILSLAHLGEAIVPGASPDSAWIPAGWSLARITKALWVQGRSLANQGDVNPQTLAGAVSTATHGTGRALGSLATMARAFRLIDAHGTTHILNADSDPDGFAAARLSLGLLGAITAIEFETTPAYGLRETVTIEPAVRLLDEFHHLTADQRHGEFFVFPYADHGFFKTLTLIDSAADNGPSSDFGESAFRAACQLGKWWPAAIPATQRAMMRLSKPTTRCGPAFRIYPSDRTVRFEEMEYHFPQHAGLAATRAVIAYIRHHRLPVTFPIEFRTVRGDDIWLSPFKARVNESVAFHQYAAMEWRSLFARIEPILRDHGGRPHWGKRHTLTRADVDALYPDAERFRAVRRRFDPDGKFLNPHLRALFE